MSPRLLEDPSHRRSKALWRFQTGPASWNHTFALVSAVALVIAVCVVGRVHGQVVGTNGFRTMMNDSVARMHAAMNVPLTGDADRDFARMMIPHHKGAIDMALVELRYGKDERLKRLAQEIIVDQQQEIVVMHLALGDALPAGAPAPTQVRRGFAGHEEH